ncbi:IMP dehydrogenase [Halovenus aranensis]|jgi:IMP dehydrogenase|uniref:IMP dehydrogenase n=1 Tax=Halovenus aranensis TaxID=890420 RepID=A0A1G8VPC1_9EURY|nr:CBS domain-containing protein [Halovenus aranensis]SDJ67040.1 IMP dehydrogenase [Halovenus aranensis]
MNVEDVMTSREEVVTVEVPGTRDDALDYLQERQFSSVPAVKETDDGEQFRGIVSRSSLIKRPDEDQLALLAEEVASTTTGTPVSEVADLMLREGERRIPVLDADELDGIVTVTDIVRAIARGAVSEDVEVGSVEGEEVNCVYSDTPLPVAERQLAHAGVPYAVVLGEDGNMTGMLTEVDILDVARVVEGEEDIGESIANEDDEWAWEGIKAVGNTYMPTRNVEIPNGAVEAFMTADVVSVSSKRPVTEAAQLMIEHDIEQIPIVSGGQLSGIVQDVDLLEAIR